MKAKFKIGDWVKPKNGKEFKVGDIFYDIYDHYIKYLEKGCVVYHPEHLLEPVTDFRVGDTVEVVKMRNTDAHYWMKDNFIGTQGVIKIIRNHSEKFFYCEFTEEIIFFDVELKLITRGGSKISKYEEMVERIEKVEGWDKEADDILTEIRGKYFTRVDFSISQDRKETKTYATGEIKVNNNSIGFYHNFYEKNEIFKQALRWLLDNSSIKPAPKVTIADLMKEVEDSMQALREEINDN